MDRRFLAPVLLLGFSIILAVMGGKSYFYLADGFTPESIYRPVGLDPRWKVAPLDEKLVLSLSEVMSKPFAYLGKGTQSYVFLSADGRYVLKFFKAKHLRIARWVQMLAKLPYVGPIFEAKCKRRLQKRDRIFTGCKLAYEALYAESGIHYLHLNPESTPLMKTVVLIDKAGWYHEIDLEGAAFYLQRAGSPVFTALTHFLEKGNLEGGRRAVSNLIRYLAQRSEMGILDRDPNYANNLGFIDGVAGNLDVGNITTDTLIRNPREFSRRIIDHTIGLRLWIRKQWPDLLTTFETEITALNKKPD